MVMAANGSRQPSAHRACTSHSHTKHSTNNPIPERHTKADGVSLSGAFAAMPYIEHGAPVRAICREFAQDAPDNGTSKKHHNFFLSSSGRSGSSGRSMLNESKHRNKSYQRRVGRWDVKPSSFANFSFASDLMYAPSGEYVDRVHCRRHRKGKMKS